MSSVDPALWRDMLAYLWRRHEPICRQWFEDLKPANLDGGLLKIQTDTAVQQNYLQNKCLDPFNEAAQAVTNRLVTVRFVNEPDQPGGEAGGTVSVIDAPVRAAAPSAPTRLRPATVTAPQHDDFAADQIVLSPDYSFENFITGPNNQLAYAASVAVANQPGVAYNPLFIHGGVGLGKTHLLQAICQQILNAKPATHILYVSCDAFMNQFIDCVQSGQMADFRNRYRHVDMLVIDDIHFLGSGERERSQEEFFHTFNELYQSNRQIVLSSDAPPSDIPKLEERLVSRFQWGLVAQVSKPSYETRVAIIRAKAKLRAMEVPEDVVDYVARTVDSNARELEGAITTLQGHANLQDRPIDLLLAREALGDLAQEPRNNQATLQQIIEAVTGFYNIKLSDLQSRRRHKSVTEPRQVCMYLARKRTRYSLEEVGGHFGGRDHTTVMHSIKTVEQRVETDAEFANLIQRLDETVQRSAETAAAV